MRAITHKLIFELAEDLLYDLNEFNVRIRLVGLTNASEWAQAAFGYTEDGQACCDIDLIQPIGTITSIELEHFNNFCSKCDSDVINSKYNLWNVFIIENILIWNEDIDKYDQYSGIILHIRVSYYTLFRTKIR